ncbi:hypothetical protein V6N11_013766 [Hibiscus sabdariffa]|uniref:Uncharacterized protein n=2 Tax=Hibiscus sabdariffa TaxID=183260 RepID=A0ABR1ZXS7_9ROSI
METPPSNDLRLPKKQRRRDENPPDGIASAHLLNKNMDCDSFPPETAIPPVSYKDVVTGGTSIPNDSILFEDDDFDFLGEDINCGIKDGISFIDFSARVQELMTKSMEYALVLKVLGCRVGYTTLYNRLLHIWKSKKPIRLTNIENDYYIFGFSSQAVYLVALTDEPWTIFGHYITVEPWSPEFDPSHSYPRRILAWIRLPELLITCPAEHSNPTDEDAAPVFESVARAPIIPPIPESHPVAATSNTNSGAHSKIDGVLRKHNLVVLGSRNLNIMPSKPSVDASSSTSKLNKGLHVQKPLNSERHTTVTLDPVTPLISATRPVPHSKHPSTGSALAGENLMHMDSSNPEPVNMNSGHLAMME